MRPMAAAGLFAGEGEKAPRPEKEAAAPRARATAGGAKVVKLTAAASVKGQQAALAHRGAIRRLLGHIRHHVDAQSIWGDLTARS